MSKQKLFKLSLDSITKSKPHFSLYIYIGNFVEGDKG